ncbi:hypothetical protein SH580_04520 [Coraliomargarita algicola]|uniref:Uncharacterized protein n=1 Tax=Coraliomargarita algicola TaxID=3092156 RepID=A0ABZ0RL80_9BACT|nr:hypothetical protein [Coraliomargarita sp. J2-16]WPJ96971.1 hypothetical protein SH580_04520 [Coraliomargarita sp. J2-16]
MRSETLTAQLRAMPDIPLNERTAILNYYAQTKSEIFKYILTFQEHMEASDSEALLEFTLLLVLGYEREGHGRLLPARATILTVHKSTSIFMAHLIETPPGEKNQAIERKFKESKEKPLLNYAFNEILNKGGLTTLSAIKLQTAVLSLIEIFSKTAEIIELKPLDD